MKKLISVVIAVLLCMATFVGCSHEKDDLSDFSNRPYKVTITYAANAYGKAWLTEIAKEYMTSHDEDTYIQLKQTVVATEEKSKISSGTASSDLYFMDVHWEDVAKSVLTDISDVYEMTALGEETLIKDKINPAMYNDMKTAGIANHVIPYQEIGMGYGMAYNKNVLDESFPNGYTLPRTTDEFVEMGRALNGQDKYLLVCSFSDNTDWIDYSDQFWLAQLMGAEGYEQFMNGRYKENGEWILNETEAVIFDKNAQYLKDWFNVLTDIAAPGNGFIHKDSNSIGFMDAEAVFAGYGFGQNNRDTAFICHAAFLESEMNWMLEDQKAANNEQVIRMMKLPVASDIINRTPTITDDAKLREVISYVDGDVTTKPDGVTDADIAIIKEARGMAVNYMGGGLVMPSTASNVEGAKKFLRYLASDEASIIASKNTYGIPFLPFGKIATEEEMGITRTDFMKDIIKHVKSTNYIVPGSIPFVVHTDHGYMKPQHTSFKTVFSGKEETAEEFFNTTKSYFGSGNPSRWQTNVKDYKIAMGLN